jgi:cysteine desulfurase
MKLPDAALHGVVRFSLSRENTDDDVDQVLDILPEIIAKLRPLSPAWQQRETDLARAGSRELIS